MTNSPVPLASANERRRAPRAGGGGGGAGGGSGGADGGGGSDGGGVTNSSRKPMSISRVSVPPHPPKEVVRVVGARCGMSAVIQRVLAHVTASAGAIVSDTTHSSWTAAWMARGKTRVPSEAPKFDASYPRCSPSEKSTEKRREPDDALRPRRS